MGKEGALAKASAPSFIRAVFRGAFGNVHSEVGKFAARLPVCRAAVFQTKAPPLPTTRWQGMTMAIQGMAV